MISTEPEYSYDSMNDIHSFNPLYTEKPTRGRSRERSTITVQNERGVTTIPVYKSEKTFNNIVELHSVETQTEDLARYGLKELIENIEDENIIDKDLMAHDDNSFKQEMPEEVEIFIDEMSNSVRHHGVRPYDAWDNLEKTIPNIVEEMPHIDGHETI